MPSRRGSLTHTSGAALATALPLRGVAPDRSESTPSADRGMSRSMASGGFASMRTPPARRIAGWRRSRPTADWQRVTVPQVCRLDSRSSRTTAASRGIAAGSTRPEWRTQTIRIEFEGVFHSARVWVNGRQAGEHLRKGYTAFAFDITALVHRDGSNDVAGRVDIASRRHDAAARPLQRLGARWRHLSPRPAADRTGDLRRTRRRQTRFPISPHTPPRSEISAVVRNATNVDQRVQLGHRVTEDGTGLVVLAKAESASTTVKAGETRAIQLSSEALTQPRLWHYDQPHLYELTVLLDTGAEPHEASTTFGVRRIEVKNGAFYVNGERMRLMGVERMAGSNPEFGMAEPGEWIARDHDDLKNLNCVFTRVHWPQDRRVLDYCDRHGIFIQTEVPTWGPDTFKGMGPDPLPALMQNGLEQLREMIDRDRNHPSIFSWGLCNEINGQHPPAAQFARRMYQEAKSIDPHRLCSYASNSLQQNPGSDVSAVMDFIEWNGVLRNLVSRHSRRLAAQLERDPRGISGQTHRDLGVQATAPARRTGRKTMPSVSACSSDTIEVFHDADFVAGLIFFCYNDYRTHIGDRGLGPCNQRIHGVVDLYGARKPWCTTHCVRNQALSRR